MLSQKMGNNALLYIISLLFLIVGAFLMGFNIIVAVALSLAVFAFLIWLFSRKDTNVKIHIYLTLFSVNLIYALLCDFYMEFHGFSYLLVFDTNNVVMPNVQSLVNYNSFGTAIKEIWDGYDIFNRFQVGYYSYLTCWSFLAKSLNADLYFSIQLAHFSACSIISVLIYVLLRYYGQSSDKAKHYALVISLCSIVFYYNSTIIRDGIITILILLIFNIISSENYSFISFLKIILYIFLISTFRIETALGCCLYLCAFFILSSYKSKQSFINVALLSVGVIVGTILLSRNLEQIASVYESNYQNYVEGVDDEAGIMGKMQRLPPIIKGATSIIFTAINPIPCWARLSDHIRIGRPECLNIMNFPTVIAAFFNFYIIVYLIFSLIFKRDTLKIIPKTLVALIVFGIIFMSLQTTVVAQRRIMGAYISFYCVWALLHSRFDHSFNVSTLRCAIILFCLLQSLFIKQWLL